MTPRSSRSLTRRWQGETESPTFGEFGHGHAAVGLQQREDFAVDGIEGNHWDEPHKMKARVVKYPNSGGYSAKI
jgi:hypothetical protein